ncbi:hypothetical protein GCM10027610_118680 [Dactylosporangium cerinum]
MNTFDWDFDDHPSRGTDVRRRLMLDHRSYDVTAFDDGSGIVGLRLVGWDSGYVFTELVVELPVGDATDVGQLLASALAGFRGGGSPPPGSPLGSPPLGPPHSGGWLPYDRSARDPRPTAPKFGQPWEPADLELLVRRFREGATIKTLTVELGRTDGAIRQRLQILGEVRPAPVAEEELSTAGEPEGGLPSSLRGHRWRRCVVRLRRHRRWHRAGCCPRGRRRGHRAARRWHRAGRLRGHRCGRRRGQRWRRCRRGLIDRRAGRSTAPSRGEPAEGRAERPAAAR